MAFLMIVERDHVIQLPLGHRDEHLCATSGNIDVRVATDTAAFLYKLNSVSLTHSAIHHW